MHTKIELKQEKIRDYIGIYYSGSVIELGA